MTLLALNIVLGIMVTIVLGLTTWILVTVHALAKNAAAGVEKEKAQDEHMRESRKRIIAAEEDIKGLKMDVVQLSAGQPLLKRR